MSKTSTIKRVITLPILGFAMTAVFLFANTNEADAWSYWQPSYDGLVYTRTQHNMSPAAPGYMYHYTNPYGNGSSGYSFWSQF